MDTLGGMNILPLTPFTFGTGRVDDPANPAHVAVAQTALEAGVSFHTSHAYADGRVLQVMQQALDNVACQPAVGIFKVDGRDPRLLQESVEANLLGTGLRRMEYAQLCGNPDVALLRPGGAVREAMDRLRDEGTVGSWLMEVYWSFSPNALQVLEADLVDGFILYLNVVNREASNELWQALQQSGKPLVALRAVGGGERSFADTGVPTEAEQVLESLMERSGCATRAEFRLRFLFSLLGVKSAVGATRDPDHLALFLKLAADPQPLASDIVQEIQQYHSIWFASHGLV